LCSNSRFNGVNTTLQQWFFHGETPPLLESVRRSKVTVHQKIHSSGRSTGRTLGLELVQRLVHTGNTSNIQMNPWMIFGKLAQEQPGNDAAAAGTGGVCKIGNAAVYHFS